MHRKLSRTVFQAQSEYSPCNLSELSVNGRSLQELGTGVLQKEQDSLVQANMC